MAIFSRVGHLVPDLSLSPKKIFQKKIPNRKFFWKIHINTIFNLASVNQNAFEIILSEEKVYVYNLTRLRPHSIILGLSMNGKYIGDIRLVNPYGHKCH